MEAFSRASFDDALQRFSNAVDLDPNFGLAYAGMAVVSRNLDRQEDAEAYLNEAISHLDSMTERERFRTRGLFYAVTGDDQSCVTEYGDLIARYAGDTASRNNLAFCASYLREWPTALDEMAQLVDMVPERALYRENLATYLSYAGDFLAGEEAALNESGVFGLLPLAFAQLGQGRLPDATATYQALGEIDALGASYRASGLADVAIYEARFADAVRILREGARRLIWPTTSPTEPDESLLSSPRHMSCGARAGRQSRPRTRRWQPAKPSRPGSSQRESLSRPAKWPEPERSPKSWPQSSKPRLRPSPRSSKVRPR